MKPSPRKTNAVIAHETVKSKIIDSPDDSTDDDGDDDDECNSSVYEFPETDDAGSVRTLGYQKPKHMWMAKEQALTKVPTSPPLPASAPTSIASPYQDCNGAIPPSDNISVNGANVSPTHSTDLASTCDLNSFPTSLSSSVVSTTADTCQQQPPIISQDTTNSAEDKPTNNTKTSVPKRSTISRRGKNNERKPMIDDKSKKVVRKRSLTKGGPGLTLKLKTLLANDRSRSSKTASAAIIDCRVSRSVSMRKSKTEQVATDLPISTTHSDLPSENPDIDEKPLKCKSSESLSNSPILSGGLKIRLRRDSTPMDIAAKRNRSSKTKIPPSSTTFRIVESWCDTDAPGGEYSHRAAAVAASTLSTSSPLFTPLNGSTRVGDIVWAKLAGYPHWPSRVSAIWARTDHQLQQATPLPPHPTKDASPLSVLATPTDPSLASGYTAKVDWLAWDQCSYLSCAKLYPFKEAYDKMYNPRTRVKGYADAVKLAKRFADETTPHCCSTTMESQLSDLSPITTKSHSSLVSAPPSTDSHWSLTSTLQNSIDPALSSIASNPPSREANMDKDPPSVATDTGCGGGGTSLVQVGEQDLDPFASGPNLPLPIATQLIDSSFPCDITDITTGMSNWAPLPQLDISGFGDFASHVPTFSEDEDDIVGVVTSQLQIDFV